MWVFQIFGIVWRNIFTEYVIPPDRLGGIGLTFGDILFLSFIGTVLATFVSMFIHRGE